MTDPTGHVFTASLRKLIALAVWHARHSEVHCLGLTSKLKNLCFLARLPRCQCLSTGKLAVAEQDKKQPVAKGAGEFLAGALKQAEHVPSFKNHLRLHQSGQGLSWASQQTT